MHQIRFKWKIEKNLLLSEPDRTWKHTRLESADWEKQSWFLFQNSHKYPRTVPFLSPCYSIIFLGQHLYIYKFVISVCLFVCPILTQEPLDWFASNFDWKTREIHENVLSMALRFLIESVDLNSEKLVSRRNHSSAGKRRD